jgi:hypothetical protein
MGVAMRFYSHLFGRRKRPNRHFAGRGARLFSPLGAIGAPRGLQSAIEFDLNKLRIFY